ncbi:MAG: dipeptidase [Anaerolineae bacterium]
MIVVDGHLDLSMNAINWNRDLRLSAYETRCQEAGMTEKGRGTGTVGFPDMRAGKVALSFATLIARVAWPGSGVSGYQTQEIAYGMAQGQLAYYRQLEAEGVVRTIRNRAQLERHLSDWAEPIQGEPPLGFVLSMEGADPIVCPAQVQQWWDQGLRVASLSHYGFSAYSHGHDAIGGLFPRGRDLLHAMQDVGMILDVSHLSFQAFWEALQLFPGPVLASHNNCRALVAGNRQFTDAQVRALIERDAVIGAALDAWMLYPGWVRGRTSPRVVSMEDYVNHIDHICQLAGNARHAAIGSDLDGGYGTEQCPYDLDTIADLQEVADILKHRGYSQGDIEQIMYGNWVRLLRRALPED